MGTHITLSVRAWAFALALVLTQASVAQAEPLQLEGRVGLAKAFGSYQDREFSIGFEGAAGVNLPFSPEFGLDGRLGVIFLGDGEPPKDPRFEDGGPAISYSARLGVQVRPWGGRWGNDALSGFWLSAGGGAALTGRLIRPLVEANLGYDFVFRAEGLGIGPAVTYARVFQPDSALRPEDANVLSIGVHGVLHAGVEAALDEDPDKDGVVAPAEQCPAVAEDLDGFEDADGCPDSDNDQDGLADKADRCPDNAEDRDGFQDTDGCPELDNDRDLVLDKDDKCRDEPEDRDAFEDSDGCVDPDNDKDGLLDASDACPNEPEVVNGYADEDGCPDTDQVRVVGDKIVLDEKVHFQVNNATIRTVSHGLLKRVAQLINDNPDYIHIEVQGHADRKGNADFNMKLSASRAESVMHFLIKHGGLAADRMSFVGLGEDQPLLDRDDEWALFMNRRVEFKITRAPRAGADAPVTVPPATTGEVAAETSETQAPMDLDAEAPANAEVPANVDAPADTGEKAPAKPTESSPAEAEEPSP
jgi:outer membrane protein OmpA-like peptidoglycan-associated protein